MITYEYLLDKLGLDAGELSPDRVAALKTLGDGKVPARAVNERRGRGTRPDGTPNMLRYYKHEWARELLRRALGLDGYSVETLDYQYYPGPGGGPTGSCAAARVRLTVYLGDDCATTTQLGVLDNTFKLNPANAQKGAEGRGICACLMQMFGLGAEFYEAENANMSAAGAWQTIQAQIKALGLDEDGVKEQLKRAGIIYEDLGARYDEVMGMVQGMARTGPAAPTVEPAPEGPVVEAATEDPVVEAAKALGAEELTQEEADQQAGLNGALPTDALAEEVAAIRHWGNFFDVATGTMDYVGATDTREDLIYIFGSSSQYPKRPDETFDWPKMYKALRLFQDLGAKREDETREAVLKELG